MQDFEIPTAENRLVVRRDKLYQVAVDWSREERGRVQPLGRRAQQELKRIVAAMLVEDEDRATVRGKRVLVSVRKVSCGGFCARALVVSGVARNHALTREKFDGAVVRDTFEFSKKKRRLDVQPWVYRFSVTEVEGTEEQME